MAKNTLMPTPLPPANAPIDNGLPEVTLIGIPEHAPPISKRTQIEAEEGRRTLRVHEERLARRLKAEAEVQGKT